MAADMATKAPPAAPAPPPSPWDVAISAALMTDYNFRGITQSAHNPSTQAGFELRYNQTSTMQWYAGLSGESIDFPNDAAAEIDIYGGFRPTFDKLALDFG
ncbi:MAG TPA: TorF family putative porin, partial [Xanthobacteraceae bacterium]|nr:TorF family putative porin [Xanthobacteraceae bacterium]